MANMTPQEAYLKCFWDDYKPKPELEWLIAQNGNASYLYAEKSLKGRFFAGEKAICDNVTNAYGYAVRVVKSAFPQGHFLILNSKWRNDYLKFLKSINYDMQELDKEVEWMI